MQSVLLLCLLVGIAYGFTDKDYQTAFTNWMQTNKKSYHHDEFHVRYRQFKLNMDFVDQHNKGQFSYQVGLNKFADLSGTEFAKIYTGLQTNVDLKAFTSKNSAPVAAPPATWDWRSTGAVTGIKNQAQCGSCWAFSTTGSTEGCHKIKTGSLVSLSEQNLMDCSGSYGNEGCDGGLMTQAMQYIISNGGIDTEATYPYTAQDGNCQWNPSNSGATLASYVNVNSGDESDLQQKVWTGPTSVAIDASQASFQMYTSGVYSDPNCSPTQLDHGVLAVGWNTDASGGPYWIVKNSWGTDWGFNGYIWMARNDNNMCGIATMATLPVC